MINGKVVPHRSGWSEDANSHGRGEIKGGEEEERPWLRSSTAPTGGGPPSAAAAIRVGRDSEDSELGFGFRSHLMISIAFLKQNLL